MSTKKCFKKNEQNSKKHSPFRLPLKKVLMIWQENNVVLFVNENALDMIIDVI